MPAEPELALETFARQWPKLPDLQVDQAALHGLLQKTRDLGLPLISVTYVEPGHPPMPTIETR